MIKTLEDAILEDAKAASVGTDTRKQAVEHVLGPVTWVSATTGYIRCPGQQCHTTAYHESECAVFIDKVPTIYCLHQSCEEDVQDANRKLRAAVGRNDGVKHHLSAEEKEFLRKKRERESWKARAKGALPDILSKYAWDPIQVTKDSPVRLPDESQLHWLLFHYMFNDDDVIWIGDRYHSGSPSHTNNFRTIAEWRNLPSALYPLTCPAVFKPGTFSRSNEQVLRQPYLVVESDVLTKPEICAVFRWLREKMELRAIIDTAGKSLHGWFIYPPEDLLEQLKVMLPAMGCDKALFKPSQPCRLPGALRDGKPQRFIWLGGF